MVRDCKRLDTVRRLSDRYRAMSFKLYEADSTEEWRCVTRFIDLVWTDPPFGTGKRMTRGDNSYEDVSPDKAVSMTGAAIDLIVPHLKGTSVVCICADYRIVHDLVPSIQMGCGLYFQSEIIWTFGLGRPRTNWWPVRHNTILTFTTGPDLPLFDKSAIPREIRKAPKVGYEGDKAAGSVWDFTMSNTDPQRVGYPNQKPIEIIVPFILAHTKPGDIVADPFMGSGSTGVAALRHKRNFIGQDLNPKAVKLARRRLRTL